MVLRKMTRIKIVGGQERLSFVDLDFELDLEIDLNIESPS